MGASDAGDGKSWSMCGYEPWYTVRLNSNFASEIPANPSAGLELHQLFDADTLSSLQHKTYPVSLFTTTTKDMQLNCARR